MSEEDLNKCIKKFFKDQNVKQSLEKVSKLIEEYSTKNLQSRMIKKIFQYTEKQIARQNIKTIIKRELHLINQILTQKQAIQGKYKQAVSAQIVDHFMKMLKSVLTYEQTGLFAEMKFYRKRWAKLITEEAYNALKKEAIKQLNMDLDKGFAEEMLTKLETIYKKRRFTQQEIQKYLPITNNLNQEIRKGSAANSQQEREDKPRKKVKRQSKDRSLERRNEYSNSDMLNARHSSFIPSNSNTYGNGYGVDPRRPNQTMYPSIYPPPNSYFPPNLVNYSPVGQYPPQNFYPPPSYGSSYGYPTNYNPPVMQNPSPYGPPPTYDMYRDPRYKMAPQPRPMQPEYNRSLQKLENIKRSWSFQCKFCGLLISTSQKYDQHMFNHFSQSQKEYEISHSRTEHQKKPNKARMPSIQEWIQSNRIKTRQQKFVVPIQGGISTGNQNCMICRGELKITWSDDIQSWVYEDAVRTKNPDAKRSICHADCFQAIDEFERSSDQLVR